MSTIVEPTVPHERIQFDLKSLLLFVAAAGILLAPYQLLGGYYLFSAVLSLTLVIFCSTVYRHAGGVVIFAAIAAIFVGIVVVMGSPMLLGHAVLNIPLSVVLVILRVRPKTYAILTACLPIGLYGYCIWGGYDRIQELAELRAEFPLVSLEKRLSFQRTTNSNAMVTPRAVTITPAVLTRLEEFEQHQNYSRFRGRQWALQQLHENITMHFARAAGFGVMRMGSIHRDEIEREPAVPLAMPAPLDNVPALPSASDLLPFHSLMLGDFVDLDRMGYVRSRTAVAGFRPHRVANQTDIFGDVKQAMHWQVDRLQLVSLLRHEPPRVYVTDELPAMDQLTDVPHRALSEFEVSALRALETTEDVVVDQTINRIQMLGAVRAARTCLECHEGERGQLLGAFSYYITPAQNKKDLQLQVQSLE